MNRRVAATTLTALLVTGLALGASPASAGSKQKPLRILVTNDDGVAAPGIDALVEGLRKLPNVKVTVIAPAENQSGSGGDTTPGELVTTETETASGFPAVAVTGFPADTVVYAIDQGGMEQPPDLVVSGINSVQNLSGLADEVSGTVGAAKAAAERGIPALAVSQGLLENAEPDYPSGVKQAVKWVKQHRKALTPEKGKEVEVILENLNVPTCAPGLKNRGLVEVPLAPNGTPDAVANQDCASTLEDPTNDIEAFNNGFVTLSEVAIPAT
jgi:5'-nucleotidase